MYTYLLLALQAGTISLGALGLGWWLHRRLPVRWATWGWGAAAFVAAQVIHIPVLTVLSLGLKQVALSPAAVFWITVLILGGTAGLFEESARYVILRWVDKRARSWDDAVMFGAGHGGIEAILIALYSVVIALVLLTSGDALVAQTQAVSPEQAAALASQLAGLRNPHLWAVGLAVWERVIGITTHIALSILVMRAVRTRRIAWLGLAILAHAIMDGMIGIVGRYTNNNIFAVEAVLTALTLVAVYVIVQSRRQARAELSLRASLTQPQHA